MYTTSHKTLEDPVAAVSSRKYFISLGFVLMRLPTAAHGISANVATIAFGTETDGSKSFTRLDPWGQKLTSGIPRCNCSVVSRRYRWFQTDGRSDVPKWCNPRVDPPGKVVERSNQLDIFLTTCSR